MGAMVRRPYAFGYSVYSFYVEITSDCKINNSLFFFIFFLVKRFLNFFLFSFFSVFFWSIQTG